LERFAVDEWPQGAALNAAARPRYTGQPGTETKPATVAHRTCRGWHHIRDRRAVWACRPYHPPKHTAAPIAVGVTGSLGRGFRSAPQTCEHQLDIDARAIDIAVDLASSQTIEELAIVCVISRV
jgi:hypothetical protein